MWGISASSSVSIQIGNANLYFCVLGREITIRTSQVFSVRVLLLLLRFVGVFFSIPFMCS